MLVPLSSSLCLSVCVCGLPRGEWECSISFRHLTLAPLSLPTLELRGHGQAWETEFPVRTKKSDRVASAGDTSGCNSEDNAGRTGVDAGFYGSGLENGYWLGLFL